MDFVAALRLLVSKRTWFLEGWRLALVGFVGGTATPGIDLDWNANARWYRS